jgi:hypothetical protein
MRWGVGWLFAAGTPGYSDQFGAALLAAPMIRK